MSARPPIPLYIWRSSPSLATARVQTACTTLPQQTAAMPAGNTIPFTLSITDGLGNLEDLTGRSYWLGIGNLNAPVTGGTFAINDSGAGTTGQQIYNINAVSLQALINAMNTGLGPNSNGGVTVEGCNGAPWTVIWNANGAQSLLNVNITELVPNATAIVTREQAGSSMQPEIQLIRIVQQAYALQTSFAVSGTVATCSLVVDSAALRQELNQNPNFQAFLEIQENDGSGDYTTICQAPVQVNGEALPASSINPTLPPAQFFNTTLLAGSFTYTITFPIKFASAPTKFLPGISFAGTPTEILAPTIGNATTTGCTLYLNGAPSTNCVLTLLAAL